MESTSSPEKYRFYVTMTWDDWPDGGSYGTIVLAESHDQAEDLCRQEMAEIRAFDDYRYEEVGADDLEQEYLDNYSDEWKTVDCFKLDDLMEYHLPDSSKVRAFMEKVRAHDTALHDAGESPTGEDYNVLHELITKTFSLGHKAPEVKE